MVNIESISIPSVLDALNLLFNCYAGALCYTADSAYIC